MRCASSFALAVLLALTELVEPSAAQTTPLGASIALRECSPGRIGRGNFVCGPGDSFDGTARLVAADLDGNRSPEVAVLQGSRLVLFVNPDVGDEHVVAASDALDVCVPPGQARCLFLATGGLRALELVQDQVGTKTIDAAPFWKSARRLRARADGVLLVLASDGRGLYRARPVAGGYEPELLFTAPSEVRDFLPLDWDGAGEPELAVLDSVGVSVRRTNGSVLMERKAILVGEALAVVTRAGKRDGLAWLTRASDKAWYLFHFRPEFGAGFEGPLPLGSLRYDSLDAADLDGDGDGDLVLGGRSGGGVPILHNQAAAADQPAFAGIDGQFELELAEEGPLLRAGGVLLHDFFNEHDAAGHRRPAAAVLWIDPPGLRLVPQAEDASPLDSPKGTSTFYSDADLVTALQQNGCAPGGPGPLPQASWTLTLGAGWSAPGATHVEAIVRVSLVTGLAPERVALHHTVTPIPAQGLEGLQVTFEGLEGPASPEDANSVYFVQLRAVRLDAPATHVVEAWPWHVLGVSAHCDGLAWLGTLNGALPETCPITTTSCASILPCDFGIPNGGGLLGPVYIPSAVPQLKVPSSGPGVLPIVWPWNY